MELKKSRDIPKANVYGSTVLNVKILLTTKVTHVTVVIHNNGTILEQGEAVCSETDDSLWTYVTTTQVTPAQGILLDANAYDMPGHFGASSVSMN